MIDAQSLALELASWSLRGCVLAGAAALGMWAFRVRDVSVRLTVWTVVLAGALLMPVVSAVAPGLEIPVPYFAKNAQAQVANAVETIYVVQRMSAETPPPAAVPAGPAAQRRHIDWMLMAVAVWAAAAVAMLSHLLVGIWYGRRLLRDASPVQALAAAPVYESDALRVPVTMGSVQPAIVLPPSWRTWDEAKLRAVLAHESAHALRRDPLRLFAASVYRAVFWFHPLAWWLHRRIADLAEAASDDAALAASADGAQYAEVLLSFFAAAPRRVQWDAVAMATQGKATKRMERILDNRRRLSTGVSRGVLAAVTILAVPALWMAASASPVWAMVSDQEPPAVPAPPPPPAVPGVPAGVAGGVRGGVPGGVTGGVEGAIAPAPPAQPLPPMDVPMALAAGAVPPQPPMPAVAPPPPPAGAHMAMAADMAQAPPAPPAPPRPPRFHFDGEDFAIVSSDNTQMFGHMSRGDNERIRAIQKQAGTDILWFRRNGEEYVVKDPAIVKQARDAFAAVNELGRQMGEKGRAMGERGRKIAEEIRQKLGPDQQEMSRIGAEMGRVGSQMSRAVGNEGEMAKLETRMRELEKEMNVHSAKMKEFDAQFRAQDGEFKQLDQKLKAEMDAMGREMEERSAEAQKRLKSVEDEAIRNKKAEKLL